MSTINEEKLIKKKYGEKMWHYCRTTFPSILETNGQLYKLLTSNFAPSHKLYDHLEKSDQLYDFRNYIFSLLDKKQEQEIDLDSLGTPSELLSEAGYILYECHTEDEIQAFKKYYAHGEELCTFKGDRLESCHVFFAVKKNVDDIRREDFKNPKRQDEYGTSVISIQFSKDEDHSLSIKNRYNHTVRIPDATYSNDLDNIIPGLTASFEKYYGLKQRYKQDIELEGFEYAEGKMYKSFLEEHNVSYCEDNIIIDNGRVIDTYRDKGRYLICGYYIFDKVKKEFFYYGKRCEDHFFDTLKDAIDIEVLELGKGKRIVIKYDGYDAVITLDEDNMIIGYDNPGIEVIGNYFMYMCDRLCSLNIPNARVLGEGFCIKNKIENVYLPSVEEVGIFFMSASYSGTKSVDMPKLKRAGQSFCRSMRELESLNVPCLERLEDFSLINAEILKRLSLPMCRFIGKNVLVRGEALEELYIPNVEVIDEAFLYWNNVLKALDAPSLRRSSSDLLSCNAVIESINAPLLEISPVSFINKMVRKAFMVKEEEVKDDKVNVVRMG